MSDSREKFIDNQSKIHSAIRHACSKNFGVLDSNFLCQSLSILEPQKPLCLGSSDSVKSAVDNLKTQRMGCVLIIDEKGKLEGIFSERDYIIKVYGSGADELKEPISTFMTREPLTVDPVTTIAFALNLMSQGGFRHLPVIDSEQHPVGIISVKNIVDYIANSFLEDVLNFDIEGGLDPEVAQ